MQQPRVFVAAEPRTVLGKEVSGLRRAGWTPANIFGGAAGVSVPIQIITKDIELILKHTPRTAVLGLNVAGTEEPVVIKGIARKPTNGALFHVDLMRVSNDYVPAVAVVVPVAADDATEDESTPDDSDESAAAE